MQLRDAMQILIMNGHASDDEWVSCLLSKCIVPVIMMYLLWLPSYMKPKRWNIKPEDEDVLNKEKALIICFLWDIFE